MRILAIDHGTKRMGIAVSDELQRKLLVDNPMRLYWPEEFNNGS